MKDLAWLKEQVNDYLDIEGVEDARMALKAVLGYIDQLDTRELPEIPDYVAEYIEIAKNRGDTLAQGYNISNYYKEGEWLLEKENCELFARAWLNGYTVEERYKVLGKGRESILLVKDRHGEVVEASDLLDEEYTWISSEVLTEQEIKDYDERYWPFAVKVEELEE